MTVLVPSFENLAGHIANMEKLKELEAKTEEELHNITILAYQVITKSSLLILLDLLTDN